MANPDFNDFFTPTNGQIPSQFLPLDLNAAGIGTSNTFDTSNPGTNFAAPASGLYTGTQSQPAISGSGDSSTALGDTSAVATGSGTVAIGGVEGWFLRGTIIVLGFIFVGVGLSMFRTPGQTIIEATKGVVGKTVPAA